jgi:hypothetical protein
VSIRRDIAHLLALVGLTGATAIPHSVMRNALWSLAFGYLTIEFLLRARAGYLRRRPHWTRESWRRYLTVCTVPAGALVILFCMLVALDWRLPIVGAAQSPARRLWAVVSMAFMAIGAGGTVFAIQSLFHGDPSRQFPWPRRLSRRPGSAGLSTREET